MNRKERRAQGLTRGQEKRPGGADPIALHQSGIEAFAAGRLADAARLIGQAIALCEPVPEFHYNLAIVLKAAGMLEEAATQYQRAIALRPDHVNAHNNLGNVWKALGKPDQARASFTQALAHNPQNADSHYSLGILCREAGETSEARMHLRRCLDCDPADSRGVAILLAHLGDGTAPERTSEAQLRSLYEVRARFWDQESRYFAPALVAEALRRHAPAEGKLDILDIGCGTGLAGVAVRDLASRLDGVDLSPAMLAKARAKTVYDGLVEADLAGFLRDHPHDYDAVLAAATLIHFGDLAPLFAAVSGALRGGGLFAFTLFPHDGAGDHAVATSPRLAQSGCFQHSPAYVKRQAEIAGLDVLELETATHEHDQDGAPVTGLVAVLRKGA